MKYITANNFWSLKLYILTHNYCFPFVTSVIMCFFEPGWRNISSVICHHITHYVSIFLACRPASGSFNCLIDCLHLCACVCVFWTAPSEVPIMHQVSSTSRSFSLSWPPPEQSNGIILDYEIRYYDKVQWDDKCLRDWLCSETCHEV